MDYLTKKRDNMRAKDRHKMVSYFFAVPNFVPFLIFFKKKRHFHHFLFARPQIVVPWGRFNDLCHGFGLPPPPLLLS